jgi:hypothetical protein
MREIRILTNLPTEPILMKNIRENFSPQQTENHSEDKHKEHHKRERRQHFFKQNRQFLPIVNPTKNLQNAQ